MNILSKDDLIKDFEIEPNTLVNDDCLNAMKFIPDNSISLILADPPYGTTACKWDSIIPLEPMWEQLKRIIKPNGAIVMTASQPFTTTLIASNMKMFKYCWVWQKEKGGNIGALRFQPSKVHEDIVVFSKNKNNYYPIMEVRPEKIKGKISRGGISAEYKERKVFILKTVKEIVIINIQLLLNFLTPREKVYTQPKNQLH